MTTRRGKVIKFQRPARVITITLAGLEIDYEQMVSEFIAAASAMIWERACFRLHRQAVLFAQTGKLIEEKHG